MAYDLFLFDLDDTLLDFRQSERLSFFRMLEGLGLSEVHENLFLQYQQGNLALWKMFEEGKTTKEHLKVERFRQLFSQNGLDLDPELASLRYLDTLPQTVVLIDHAVELCEWLSQRGEIGIITNGIHAVQMQRIANSALAPYISFVSVSETCGFAKPDIRFFEHSVKLARRFAKASSLVIGDRVEADVQGAHNFGVDCCWYNPGGLDAPSHLSPRYSIRHLSELRTMLSN